MAKDKKVVHKVHDRHDYNTKTWLMASFVCVLLVVIFAHLLCAVKLRNENGTEWDWFNPYTEKYITASYYQNVIMVTSVLWVLFWLSVVGAVLFHLLIFRKH